MNGTRLGLSCVSSSGQIWRNRKGAGKATVSTHSDGDSMDGVMYNTSLGAKTPRSGCGRFYDSDGNVKERKAYRSIGGRAARGAYLQVS
jgi:hypothetical protein